MKTVAEHEEVIHNVPNNNHNNLVTNNNSNNRPWNTPNYSVDKLLECVNPDSFKIWKNAIMS